MGTRKQPPTLPEAGEEPRAGAVGAGRRPGADTSGVSCLMERVLVLGNGRQVSYDTPEATLAKDRIGEAYLGG